MRDYKEITENLPIKTAPIPKKIRVPVSQHAGKPAVPVVKPGDMVKTGQLLARAQGMISSNIHSGITGKITAIDRFPDPVNGESLSVEIEGDGTDIVELLDGSPNPQDIAQRVLDAGVVGMGGAMFPAHVKLQPPKDKKIDSVILNGAECEPFVTCDYRIMEESPGQVVEGLKIIMDAVGASKAYIGIESNKPSAVKKMQDACRAPDAATVPEKNIEVVVLATKYPQGGEKQLIQAVLNREVPSGKLPFDAGVVVYNVSTALAVFEAVRQGKPLYERVVTVTGACVKEPANWRVRIGTLFGDLLSYSGGLTQEAGKLVMGGPMMGIAQYTFDVPVIKGTNAVLVLPKDAVTQVNEEACIRCGKCVAHCPMGLNPGRLGMLIRKEKFEEAKEAGVFDCMECGLCAYSCPSNRNLVQLVKYAKRRLTQGGRGV